MVVVVAVVASAIPFLTDADDRIDQPAGVEM